MVYYYSGSTAITPTFGDSFLKNGCTATFIIEGAGNIEPVPDTGFSIKNNELGRNGTAGNTGVRMVSYTRFGNVYQAY